MSKSIEPLSPALWFQRIAIVADGELGSLENSLRHAGHLVQLAPLPFRKILTQIPGDDEFEALLEAGALDEASLQLFGPATSVLVEAVPDGGRRRAVVACDILRRSVDADGDTAAEATLNAWARWLLALWFEFGPEIEGHAGPAGAWPAALQARLEQRKDTPE